MKNGDGITIDAKKRTLTLGVAEEEIFRRLSKWKKPKPNYTRGVLAKYARSVMSGVQSAARLRTWRRHPRTHPPVAVPASATSSRWER